MLFSDSPAMAEAWYRINERSYVISSLKRSVPGRVTLSQHDFDILAQDFREIPSDSELQKRRSSGWILGVIFHFLLGGRGFLPPAASKEERASYRSTLRKAPLVLERLERLGDGLVPGTQIRRPIAEETINSARKRQWNAAHYWAAMYTENGEVRYPEPRSNEHWLSFMHLAETLRLLGTAYGVLRTLAPSGDYDERKIISDIRFEPFGKVIMPVLSTRERANLSGYVSRTTIQKNKRPRGG